MVNTVVESTLKEKPTEVRVEELNRSKTLRFFGALGGGGESTALMAIAEEYEGNDVFGKNEGSIQLVVDSSRAFGHYLDDHRGLRERTSDYLRPEEPCEITDAGNHRLKGAVTRIVSGCIIDRKGLSSKKYCRL